MSSLRRSLLLLCSAAFAAQRQEQIRGADAFSFVGISSAAFAAQRRAAARTLDLKMSLAASPPGALQFALKKPSKTLTVSLEYDRKRSSTNDGGDASSDDDEEEGPTAMELANLSMQLRKAKVAAIWTSDVEALREFAAEQESARGDYPGPCPVIYYCGGKCTSDGSSLADALGAGATAVVLGMDSLEAAAQECVPDDVEIIWQVSSPADVEAMLASQDRAATTFLVTGEEIDATMAALPEGSVAIGAVDAMQPEGTEIASGRALKAAGCASVLVRGAVVGDAEDLDYARFAVSGLTSKASSEFNFSGLTCSANGHFGGVASSGTNKWKRDVSTRMVSSPVTPDEITDRTASKEEEGGTMKAIAESAIIEDATTFDSDSSQEVSDAALYFLSTSGFKTLSGAEAQSVAQSVQRREEEARHKLESRIERLGLSIGEEGEKAE